MKNKHRSYFLDILNDYRQSRRKDELILTLLDFLFINTVCILLFFVLESIWYLTPVIKQIFWFLLFFNVYYFFRFARSVFSSKRDQERYQEDMLAIGESHSDVKDKLLNHAQLSETSNKIAELAINEFIEKYPQEIFLHTYKSANKRYKLRSLAIALFLLIISLLLHFPAYTRIFHPKISYEPDYGMSVEFSISDTSIYSYDSLAFEVIKHDDGKCMMELHEISDRIENKELILRSKDSVVHHRDLRLKSSRTYLVLLRRPHLLYARKYLASDTLSVEVLQRPRITSLDIKVRAPEYSGLAVEHYQGNIDKITCLEGSTLDVSISLSEEAGDAFLIFDEDTLSMNKAGYGSSISFLAQESGRISILVKSKTGIRSESIPEYKLEISADEYPSIYVLTPRKNDEYLLSESMKLPYVAQLQDDYGISKFEVEYSVHSDYSFASDSSIYTVELPFDMTSRYQTRAGVWGFEQFISPGSEIRYRFAIYDNDELNGPKVSRSTLYYAKLPTLGDLFDSNSEKNEENLLSLEEELESVEDISKDVEMIRKELLQEGKLDWENKSALEENLTMLEESQKDLQELQQAMQEQKKMMDENAMFSDKVIQDFEQLQQLMNELIDDELFNMMQELQEKLKRGDESNLEKVLEDFSEKAKKFEETLDRMLEIFKRIQHEQRLEELNERIKESLSEQEKILEESEQRTNEELAEQENKLSRETQNWEELAKESTEIFSKDQKEGFEQFLEAMNNEMASDMMQESSQSFSQGDKKSGQQQSQQAKESLEKLSEQFESMSASMMQKQKKEVENAFRKAFLQCMYISTGQEKIKDTYSGISDNSPLIHAYTSAEYDMLALALELNRGLLELSKMTFLVDKVLGQKSGAVIGYLKSGLQNVEEARLSTGVKHFNNAYKNMNELGRILLERMNMVQDQQKGNASGMDFYMQQLQQMAGQQQQLNQGMQQMGMNGSPSQSMMDQMAKMAARQQALRRSLKGLQQSMNDEGGSGKRMMGDLDRIAKDMEDVINQMRKNKVNRQTIMRQEKILQRLLDASRSATTRDYKKERESKSAQAVERSNPLSLPGDLGERESLINSIRRELRESELSPEEKRQMEIYLESLLKENSLKEFPE